MLRKPFALAAASSVVALGSAIASSAPEEARPPHAQKVSREIDPKATEQLQRMQSFLRSLGSFTLDAETTKDVVYGDDFKVQRVARTHAVVRLPDRLRAEVSSDQGDRLFVYDGRELTLETKGPETYYATLPAPPTLRGTLEAAMDRHHLELPLADVIYAAAGGEPARKILAAGDVGPSRMGNVACEHIAVRTQAADWQICIEKGERPLPRRLVVTSRDSPLALQSATRLDWDLKTPVTDEAFTFRPAEGAKRIAFATDAERRPQPKAKTP